MQLTDYNSILLPNELFYGGHIRLTLIEIRDAVNVMKVAHRLPTCMWEDIKHCHATTASTIWAFCSRYNQIYYPDAIGIDKPTISLLEWIYNGIKEATKH